MTRRLIFGLVGLLALWSVTSCGSRSVQKQQLPTSTTTTPSGASGSQSITHDVTVGLDGGGDYSVLDVSGTFTRIAVPGMALFSFTAPPITDSCYKTVKLRLWLEHASGDAVATIAAYPSATVEISALKLGAFVASDNLLSNRPRSDVEVTTASGWVEWDITELTHTWARGDRFENAPVVPDPKTDVVVALRSPIFSSDIAFERTFTSSEGAPDHHPEVRWQAKPSCTTIVK